MKKADKYIWLDDTSKVKRQQDPYFGKKRMAEEKSAKGSERQLKREERQIDKSRDKKKRRKHH